MTVIEKKRKGERIEEKIKKSDYSFVNMTRRKTRLVFVK